MMKKKRTMLKIGILGILSFCMTVSYLMVSAPMVVKAEEEELAYYVYDEADLLSDEEEEKLNKQIFSFIEDTGWNVAAVTINSAQGLSSAEYADTWYEEWAGVDTDGFVILIDMDNREIYMSTSGSTIRYFYDTRIETILDDGYFYISDGEYKDCLSAMFTTAEYYYWEGIPEDQYNYDVETGTISKYRVITWMEIIPVLLVAAIAGVGTYWGVSKRYNMEGGDYDYPYTKYATVKLISKEDHFIRKSITHQRIPRNNNNGGNRGGGGGHVSSVHTSSSGGSHGGGGRKF